MYPEFNREIFFPKRNIISLKKLLNFFDKIIIDCHIDNNFEVNEISSLNIKRKDSLLFLNELKDFDYDNFNDICVISDNKSLKNNKKIKNYFLVNNLNYAYRSIINHLYIHDDSINYFDDFDFINNAFISKYSNIDTSSKVFPNCVIGKGVSIGKNCIIKSNSVIKNSIINDNVIVGENTTIGSSGFGFDLKCLGASNILPQIGIVYIDKNSSIGSNCTIDRAKIDYTYIGKNSMIDNLVHIAHNVIINDNACIAAQTGISGSVKIGKNFISGGQSGYAGHITIGDHVVVAAKSGVTKNIKSKSIVAGFPAIDIKEWKKKIIKERKNGYK